MKINDRLWNRIASFCVSNQSLMENQHGLTETEITNVNEALEAVNSSLDQLSILTVQLKKRTPSSC